MTLINDLAELRLDPRLPKAKAWTYYKILCYLIL